MAQLGKGSFKRVFSAQPFYQFKQKKETAEAKSIAILLPKEANLVKRYEEQVQSLKQESTQLFSLDFFQNLLCLEKLKIFVSMQAYF